MRIRPNGDTASRRKGEKGASLKTRVLVSCHARPQARKEGNVLRMGEGVEGREVPEGLALAQKLAINASGKGRSQMSVKGKGDLKKRKRT